MGMNYWHFANTFGQSTETRRIMIQGLMYLEFEDFYEPLVEKIGTENADSLMQDCVDYGWELYMGDDTYNPIEIGMAFYYMFEVYFNEYEEYGVGSFNLFDVEENFNYFFDFVRQ